MRRGLSLENNILLNGVNDVWTASQGIEVGKRSAVLDMISIWKLEKQGNLKLVIFVYKGQ